MVDSKEGSGHLVRHSSRYSIVPIRQNPLIISTYPLEVDKKIDIELDTIGESGNVLTVNPSSWSPTTNILHP